MEHVLLKATTTTAADLGEFEAVISSEAVDREKDIVSADGMVAALRKWNRPIPLSWNHGLKADDIFGHVDPQSARAVNGEVVINGKVDLESKTGGEAWRSFRNRTVGFSFGYLIPDGGATRRKGGGRHITALDVFEITATPAPMNNETRVLATKQVADETDDATETPLQAIQDAAEELQEFIAGEHAEGDETDVAQARRLLAGLQELVRAEQRDEPDEDKAVKAQWSTAYVNDLPDGAFLYVAPGGSKDSDGKTTPRDLRYFPVKDASGAVDQAHVRNALARIPQSNLPQSVKDAATAKARRMLDASKSVDVIAPEYRSGAMDPLRAKADALALEFASDGISLTHKAAPPPAPPAGGMTLEDMHAWWYEQTLATLSEGIP